MFFHGFTKDYDCQRDRDTKDNPLRSVLLQSRPREKEIVGHKKVSISWIKDRDMENTNHSKV